MSKDKLYFMYNLTEANQEEYQQQVEDSIIYYGNSKILQPQQRVSIFLQMIPILLQVKWWKMRLLQGMGLFCSLVSLFVFIYIDILLEKLEKISSLKDLNVMKMVHDLKNPIISLRQIISPLKEFENENNLTKSNNETTINHELQNNFNSDNKTLNTTDILNLNHRNLSLILLEIYNNVNSELEDIDEMIENLRTEFKFKNEMTLKEIPQKISSVAFIKSFKSTQMRMAEACHNKLTLKVCVGFPTFINIPKSLVKRILNNFISNSLKHTYQGQVTLNFRFITHTAMAQLMEKLNYLGDLHQSTNQLLLEIVDTGKGIDPNRIHLVFEEKESDQSENNWDGCGLGLPICQKLAAGIGARIFYNSIPNSMTTFKLCLPVESLAESSFAEKKLSKSHSALDSNPNEVNYHRTDQTIILDQNKENKIDQQHECSALFVAEDSKSVLNRQQKQADKNGVKLITFLNGLDCMEWVSQDLDQDCPHCRIRILITDLQMPLMDGIQLSLTLKKIITKKYLHVTLLTAEEIDSKFKSTHTYFDEILNKPIKISIFKQYHSLLNNSIMNSYLKKLDDKEIQQYILNQDQKDKINIENTSNIIKDSEVTDYDEKLVEISNNKKENKLDNDNSIEIKNNLDNINDKIKSDEPKRVYCHDNLIILDSEKIIDQNSKKFSVEQKTDNNTRIPNIIKKRSYIANSDNSNDNKINSKNISEQINQNNDENDNSQYSNSFIISEKDKSKYNINNTLNNIDGHSILQDNNKIIDDKQTCKKSYSNFELIEEENLEQLFNDDKQIIDDEDVELESKNEFKSVYMRGNNQLSYLFNNYNDTDKTQKKAVHSTKFPNSQFKNKEVLVDKNKLTKANSVEIDNQIQNTSEVDKNFDK